MFLNKTLDTVSTLADVSAFKVDKGEITIFEIDEDKVTASEVDCDTNITETNKCKFTASEMDKDGTIEAKIEKGKSTTFEADKENLIKGLQLLQIKEKYNISEIVFNEILKVLEISDVSLYKLQKFLRNLIPLKPTFVECCINLCIAFTDEYINKKFYLKYSFQMQYKDKFHAEILHYRYNYISTYEYRLGNQINDIFDGL
ncbi:5709_t:CDS:2 [Funneliformis caledonium]|uniref:5709_t:CDS:1 n=1 Tax=Funneliformis caledonium TaxID=1117310 RepID=A0A9N9EEG0_9GLOM|nr:5709_t:CDS:2 [Funneliformis caledonium]